MLPVTQFGRLQKPRTLKRDFKEKRPDEWEDKRIPNPDGDGYQEMPTSNEEFVQYYQKQVGIGDLFVCRKLPLHAVKIFSQ